MQESESSEKKESNASNDESQEALQILEVVKQENPELLKNLSEKDQEKLVEKITEISLVQKSHSGPLPDPATVKEYDLIIPNGAERIMRMAELEQEFRHTHTRNIAKRRLDQVTRGQWFAFILALVTLIGGFYLALQGKSLAGVVAIITAIGGLVAAFLYTKIQESKQNKNTEGGN